VDRILSPAPFTVTAWANSRSSGPCWRYRDSISAVFLSVRCTLRFQPIRVAATLVALGRGLTSAYEFQARTQLVILLLFLVL
jgi:hypothetical protein